LLYARAKKGFYGMQCLVWSSPRKDDWELAQSVEILSYLDDERKVNILYLLLAKKKGDDPNTLGFIHRGRTKCRLLQPWPIQRHPNEKTESYPILQKLYGKYFEDRGVGNGGDLVIKKIRINSDQWEDLDKPEVVIPYPIGDLSSSIEMIKPRDQGYEHIPFSEGTLKGFEKSGYYLLCISFSFCGETYDRLIRESDPFTVDGPSRLLSRIKYYDLARIPSEDRKYWDEHLQPYEDPSKSLPCRFYDIILLNNSETSNVKVMDEYTSNGIYRVFNHPKFEGLYYLTVDQAFTLPLAFSKKTERIKHPELVLTP
jgi:hypothetical protein